MRPPRFRLRTLMIAVAVVAIDCWLIECWLIETSRQAFIALLVVGALVGACCTGPRPRHTAYLYAVGGFIGGVSQALVMSLSLGGCFLFVNLTASAPHSDYSRPGFGEFAGLTGIILMMGSLAGLGIGMVVSIGSVAVFSLSHLWHRFSDRPQES
jgi:hypothetical protein